MQVNTTKSMEVRAMNIQEKQAWFTLWVVIATLVCFGVIFAITDSVQISTAAFAISALIAASGLIGHKERKSGIVVADERDHEISQKSASIAFGVFWVVFVIAIMAPFYLYGPDKTLQVKTVVLATYVFPAMLLLYAIKSIITIVLYKRGKYV